MNVGSLVRFQVRNVNKYVKNHHVTPDDTWFELYEEVNGAIRLGEYRLISTNEVGTVIKMIDFESLPTTRARVLFPSGIGWVDTRDLVEVQIQTQSLL